MRTNTNFDWLHSRRISLSAAIPGIALSTFITCANAECTAPDVYELGTGINLTGLCTSISTGATATSTAEISVNSAKSLLVQADTYAKEALATQNLIIQTEMMIRDFEENPLQVVAPDANLLLANQKRIEKLAKEIADNSSSIGTNLINNLENPETIGLGQGSRFALWSEARRKAVMEAYDSSTAFIEASKSRNKALTQAIKESKSADGATANLKAINAMQGQQLSWLESIADILTNIMRSQATVEGSRISAEISGAKTNQGIIEKPPGADIRVADDKEYSKYSGTTGF
jgi:hypothetical protein